MARLRLTLLGGFQCRADAGPAIGLPTRKSQALLAYLALPPGRSHPRGKLASLLWGDMADREARGGLRQALSALRKVMPESALRVFDGDAVALDPTAVDVDVLEFERAVADSAPEALGLAAGLYRGEFLEGLALREAPFEEWLLSQRDRLRELALEAFVKLLRHQQTAGALEDAVATALRLLALDPLQEPVHRVLMRLYVQLGRRAASLRQYQLCVSLLARDLQVEPEPATKQLYQDILRQRAAAPTTEVEIAEPPGILVEVPRLSDETLVRDVPLIGREAEMLRLREALDRNGSDRGRIIAVVGEAGVGKSRFVAECAAEASARGGCVLVGRCHESEQILPFGPWVDALRAAQLNRRDPAVEGLAPLYRTALGRLLPELSSQERELQLGPMDHRQLFEGVTQVVRSLAVRQPLMVILEDLHWADEMSVRLLSYLGRRLPASSILVVGTVRAEDLEEAAVLRRTFEDLGQGLVRLPLPPLTKADTLRLARTLALGAVSDEIMNGLFAQIWSLSEGNPLVVVETVRALPEEIRAESTSVRLPQRVREVIVRHLERSSERARQLAVVAAVIGHEFEFPLLQRAGSLDECETAEAMEELVRRRILKSVGEQFDFTHDRIREAVYANLLPERRRALHAQITLVIEDLYADRLVDWIERLVHHATRGGLREKAVAYLRQAGSKAFSNSAHAEALANFTHALDLLATLPAGEDRDREELGVRLALGPTLQVTRGYAAPEVEANYRRARALSGQVGDLVQQFQALWGLWLLASHRANVTTALTLGGELLALGERSGDPALLLEGHHALWPVLIWSGRVSAARPHVEHGIALYDKAQHRGHAFIYGGHDPGMCCLKCASWAFWLLGYPERGLEYSVGSLSLAEDLRHPPSLVTALAWACIFRDLRREADAVRRHARELMKVASDQGTEQWLATGTIFDGCVGAELGEGEAAVAQIGRGIDGYLSTSAELFLPYFLSLQARAHVAIGQSDVGLEIVGEALKRARSTGELLWEPELVRLEGEYRLRTRSPDIGSTIESFHRAIAIAQREQARAWQLRAAVSLARVLAANGERDVARSTLADVYGGFTEGFDTADLRDARRLLSELVVR